jgi:hypothetical protein
MKTIDNELKNAWIRQLRKDWHLANYTYFQDKMYFPIVKIFDSKRLLGQWDGEKQTLSISSFLIKEYPWEYVREVLYHEMVHQYMETILDNVYHKPHGEVFRELCREREIDSRASGDIKSWVEKKRRDLKVGSGNHKIIDKVHKLFSLAQSTNQYEAELAMKKAHELLLKHNLSSLEVETQRNYIHKQIGEVGRKNTMKSKVCSILLKFFFVELLWTFGYDQRNNKEGSVLEIYGTPENVAIAEYVHDYLQNICGLLWVNYKKEQKIFANKHRRTFILGVLNGFYQKLDSKSVKEKSEGLIWKGDAALKKYFKRVNPKTKNLYTSYSKSCDDVYTSGISVGKKLVIHKGIHGKKNERSKLLK